MSCRMLRTVSEQSIRTGTENRLISVRFDRMKGGLQKGAGRGYSRKKEK